MLKTSVRSHSNEQLQLIREKAPRPKLRLQIKPPFKRRVHDFVSPSVRAVRPRGSPAEATRAIEIYQPSIFQQEKAMQTSHIAQARRRMACANTADGKIRSHLGSMQAYERQLFDCVADHGQCRYAEKAGRMLTLSCYASGTSILADDYANVPISLDQILRAPTG